MVITKASENNGISKRERRNRQLAREAAAEGIVLLENNGVLPLKPQPVALFGAGAEYTIAGGSGSGEVNVREEVSVRKGLENAGFSIVSEDWLGAYRALWQQGKNAFLQGIRKKVKLNMRSLEALMMEEYRYPAGPPLTEEEAKGADVCFYVIARQSGEGFDRKDEAGSFRLEEAEIQNIRFCAEHFPSFILILNVGSVLDLSALDEIKGIDAVLYMGQLGMEGGNALADVISGRVTPSGKLSVSWPMRYADVPFGDAFCQSEKEAYQEGIYVGYRYYDAFQAEPRYPFGYGKSYTRFAIEPEAAERAGAEIRCRIRVRNEGAYPGKETLQLYAEGPFAEQRRLIAFSKSQILKPGETEVLTVCFSADALAVYEEAAAETAVLPGCYRICCGSSSRCLQPFADIQVPERLALERHKPWCSTKEPVSEWNHAAPQREKETPSEVPFSLSLPADCVHTIVHDYALSETAGLSAENHLRRMSKPELIRLCAGTGIFGEKKGFLVPGAAGHTTTAFLERDIPNVELCDGPAGLRLQKRSVRTKNGSIKPLDAPISVYDYLPALIRKVLLGNPKKGHILYQFVTGFPAAAMQAQTWNPELVCRIGHAVGEEMEEYGVRIWLAPALNIVRNPLCGRNYEYYSEDPLLSGKLAAAVTRGVQDWPGRVVTLKHFAANNREADRFTSSSELDERTLREIYLKGFQIAVREGRPGCVMTAYNQINGVYCANSRELCTDILRCEWGFEGVVMTDWFAVAPGRAEEGRAIEAGVDLIMPGGGKTRKNLERQLRGEAAEAALRRAAGRVLRLILPAGRA